MIARPDDPDLSLPDVARAWAARTPDVVAVADERSTLTFAALEAEVDAAARRIAADAPAGSGVVVLVQDLPGSLTGFLAGRRAGRLTTVLDATAPDAHLDGCFERFPAVTVVTGASTRERVAGVVDGPVVLLGAADPARAASVPERLDLDQPAVVAFTSGSTGRPKAVVHSERSSLILQRRTVRTLRLSGGDRYGVLAPNLGATSMTAVSAMVGGVGAYGYALDRGLAGLPAWVAEQGITVLPMTRGLVRAVAESLPAGVRLDPLRLIRIVGEPLLPGDLTAARRILPAGAELMFELGMNEAGVLAGRVIPPDEVEQSEPVTVVGPVVDDVDLTIVDDDGRAAAPGEVGEIVVRGPGVALGYLDEPALTEARFRGAGADRTFATGDRGRLLADGRLEVLGRTDERLKIRGFTVEPTEVEAALLSLRGVAEAAVTAAPDARGAPQLVAYLVPSPGARLRSSALRRQLHALVAPQFVPTVFAAVAEIPRTTTGKIDRAALRHVAVEALAARPAYEPPHGERERMLTELVSEILRVEEVGRDDDIFDLGADSLDLLELFAALSDQLDVDLPQQTLLEAPTVALLAARLDEHLPRARRPTILLSEPSDAPPFFCVAGRGAFAFGLRPFALALAAHGPWPVHAIEAFDADDAGSDSLHAIATRRVAAVRSVQPHGPYHLGGYSLGGLIALEIARRLRAEHETVDLVVLIDTAAPRSRAGRRALQRDWARARWPRRGLHDRLRRAKYMTIYNTYALGLWPKWFVRRQLRSETPGRRARRESLVELDAMFRDGYRLEPYDGRVLYVQALDQAVRYRTTGTDEVDAFARVATGEFSIAPVSGTHGSLVEPGFVEGVAAAIAAALPSPAGTS